MRKKLETKERRFPHLDPLQNKSSHEWTILSVTGEALCAKPQQDDDAKISSLLQLCPSSTLIGQLPEYWALIGWAWSHPQPLEIGGNSSGSVSQWRIETGARKHG